MTLTAGTKLGPYEILIPIGAGGMGEVYKAQDTKLGREVAVKVLPEAFAENEERLARFEREARLLASLNHTNIATIHGLEESEGVRFLVMELVEGETLADRLARGPIPPDEVLPLFQQIAEGLEAAHEKGVIHRDLKPANIKVTPEGKVKVLDFGLARVAESAHETAGVDASQSPTLTKGTALGVIMGTASYMSPEQARGKVVDKRTDIWAFACCLHEALTAKKTFAGATVTDTLAAVVKNEPDWNALPPGTPWRIRDLLGRCLRKDANQRLHDIADARIEIAETIAAPADEQPVVETRARPQGWRRVVPYLVTVATTLIAAAVISRFIGKAPSRQGTALVSRATISLPEGQRQPRLIFAPLAISPEGTLLAYVAQDGTGLHLFLRPLDSFESRKIPGSEDAAMPFFSPDGQWVGFFAAGKLKKVSVARGSPLTITNAPRGFGASWGADDNIVYAPTLNGGLWQVPAGGGAPEALTAPDSSAAGYAHVWPQHLPGERRILFTVWGQRRGSAILNLETAQWDLVLETARGAQYLPTGHLVYSDDSSGVFLAAPFDLAQLAVTGPTVPALGNVHYLGTRSGRPFVAVSRTGTAVYVAESTAAAMLAWMDREGRTIPIQNREGGLGSPRLSPDGKNVAFHDEQGAVWSLDLERGTIDVVALQNAFGPTWNPDGRRVTFASSRAGSWDIYEISPAERGEPVPLLVRDFDQFPTSWSSDGSLLAFRQTHPKTGDDIWVLPLGEEPVEVLATEANETSPMFSPDGRWLAYVSDESGRKQVYVQSYPGGEVYPISRDGGTEPLWSRDGRELFFRKGDALLSVTITTDPTFEASIPIVLFEKPFDQGIVSTYYDVSPDGRRFLTVRSRSTTEFRVVQNWFEELKQLVPNEN